MSARKLTSGGLVLSAVGDGLGGDPADRRGLQYGAGSLLGVGEAFSDDGGPHDRRPTIKCVPAAQ
ncbi:hypothetical protein ACFV84_13945 [Kitasatospora sp. NPDC059811]|uniref:hypothetical protein n=1 Tax=Streptomycetaceae TaxID=2062 RepID=UPI0007AF1F20|nr:hypothetical protein [Streptomyces sp. MJM8645]